MTMAIVFQTQDMLMLVDVEKETSLLCLGQL